MLRGQILTLKFSRFLANSGAILTEKLASFDQGNWFFNNWGPPHPDVDVYQQWVAIVKEALSEKGATEAERALFFGGAAAKAYGLQRRAADVA